MKLWKNIKKSWSIIINYLLSLIIIFFILFFNLQLNFWIFILLNFILLYNLLYLLIFDIFKEYFDNYFDYILKNYIILHNSLYIFFLFIIKFYKYLKVFFLIIQILEIIKIKIKFYFNEDLIYIKFILFIIKHLNGIIASFMCFFYYLFFYFRKKQFFYKFLTEYLWLFLLLLILKIELIFFLFFFFIIFCYLNFLFFDNLNLDIFIFFKKYLFNYKYDISLKEGFFYYLSKKFFLYYIDIKQTYYVLNKKLNFDLIKNNNQIIENIEDVLNEEQFYENFNNIKKFSIKQEINLNNLLYKFCSYNDFLGELKYFRNLKWNLIFDINYHISLGSYIYLYLGIEHKIYYLLKNYSEENIFLFRFFDFQFKPLIFYLFYLNYYQEDKFLLNIKIYTILLEERLNFLKSWLELIWVFELNFKVYNSNHNRIHPYYLTILLENRIDFEDLIKNKFYCKLTNEEINFFYNNFNKKAKQLIKQINNYKKSNNYIKYYNELNILYVDLNGGFFDDELEEKLNVKIKFIEEKGIINQKTLHDLLYYYLLDYIEEWRIEWEINNKDFLKNWSYNWDIRLIWEQNGNHILRKDLRLVKNKVLLKKNYNLDLYFNIFKKLNYLNFIDLNKVNKFIHNLINKASIIDIISREKFFYFIKKKFLYYDLFFLSILNNNSFFNIIYIFKKLKFKQLKNLLNFFCNNKETRWENKFDKINLFLGFKDILKKSNKIDAIIIYKKKVKLKKIKVSKFIDLPIDILIFEKKKNKKIK